MNSRRYRAKRHRSGLLPLVAGALAILFFGVLVLPKADWGKLPWIVAVILLTGLLWFTVKRSRDRIAYMVSEDHLTLIRGSGHERLPVSALIDANLIDLPSARDYVLQRYAAKEGEAPQVVQGARERFLRYSGLAFQHGIFHKLWASRLGPALSGHNEMAVLLRVRGGEELLLTPRHSEDLVDAVVRAIGSFSGMSQEVGKTYR